MRGNCEPRAPSADTVPIAHRIERLGAPPTNTAIPGPSRVSSVMPKDGQVIPLEYRLDSVEPPIMSETENIMRTTTRWYARTTGSSSNTESGLRVSKVVMSAIANPRFASDLRTLRQFIDDDVRIRSSAIKSPWTELIINGMNDGSGTNDDIANDDTGVKAPDEVPTAIRGRR